MSKKLSALDYAKWFVAWADYMDDADITPEKLQCLLYYAYHVCARDNSGKKLFDNPIGTREGLPFIVDVYNMTLHYGKGGVDVREFVSDDFKWDDFSHIEKTLIGVWDTYGIYDAWFLKGCINHGFMEIPYD